MFIPRSLLAAVLSCGALLHCAAQDLLLHTFKKIQVTDKFWAEGATIGDFNHDGKMDVASGPYWYEGPAFTVRHEFYPATQTFKLKQSDGSAKTIEGYEGGLGEANTYSDNFFAFTYDFNQDGWDDILIIGFPGKEAFWYENPRGQKNADGSEHWTRHLAYDVVDDESPGFGNLTPDGKPSIICCSRGFMGYASPNWAEPARPWTFHPITPKGGYQKFTHGLGYGDVNGDGRVDMLEAKGWWEQPASLEGDPVWKFHAADFGSGGAQMYVYDVNGDGHNDVITSLAAHGYGLAWFEQVQAKGEISFVKHLIMGQDPKENKYGVHFSQMHAIDLIDMDGDGIKDIVTGKRFWAHGSHGDAEPGAPAVLYWFKLVRGKNLQVDFVPYMIDDNSGVGTQVMAGTISNPKYPDVVVGNKKGVFVFEHEARKVGRAEWQAHQPKPLEPQLMPAH